MLFLMNQISAHNLNYMDINVQTNFYKWQSNYMKLKNVMNINNLI